jgi:putative endonuclease
MIRLYHGRQWPEDAPKITQTSSQNTAPANSRYNSDITKRTIPPKLSWPAKAGHPGGTAQMDRTYYVYILASRRNGTLYVGVTNNLLRRISEHREGIAEGFTKKYGVKHLVQFELFEDINAAIHRETRLKKWRRRWKIDLIQKENPLWDDLYEKLIAPKPLPDWLVCLQHSDNPS